MTSRERALTSRLISKIEKNKQFADDIGLTYTIKKVDIVASSTKQTQHQNPENKRKSEKL